MDQVGLLHPVSDKPQRISYWFLAATLVLLGWLHMTSLLLAVLFSYLALTKLNFLKHRGKWVSVVLLLVLVSAVAHILGHIINQAVRTLPDVADQAIPLFIQWARQHQIEPPFTDYDSLRDWATDIVKGETQYLGSVAKFARGAGRLFLFVIVGVVAAISIFLNPRFELGREQGNRPNNFYSLCCEQVARRFATLFQSFATVMGAQIVISAINTVLTTIFVLAIRLPHLTVVIGLTFLFGLVPIIGNLVSNTIIVGIALTVSPPTALLALVFLVLIHKLEYFLNSKIIGGRILNPLWLTLLALILGERLMGLPGMVLAPVILHYVKVEASSVGVMKD
jgi:predicted PurR-regulated permease PerM